MKVSTKIGMVTLATILVASSGFVWSQRIRDLPPASRGVKMPALSPMAQSGQRAYDASCAQCHGTYGVGTDKGPPFLDPVYNPGHHPDASFARAVAKGVRQHHWRFGDMPAQPQVDQAQLEAIVQYVRAVQQANGIVYSEHRM